MSDAVKNFAYSLVATAPVPATSGTSLTVTASDGTKFPAVPFNATVWPVVLQPTVANAEIVTVTNIAGDVLTIVRQAEGTSARTILIGDQIAMTVTAKVINDLAGPRAPTGNTTVQSGYGMIVIDDFEIVSGSVLEILSDGVMEIS